MPPPAVARPPLPRRAALLLALLAAACGGGSGATQPPPVAPTGVTATPLGSGAVRVAWTDASTDETGFRVERGPAAAGPFSLVIEVAAGTTAIDDPGLAPATTYHYRVAALRGAERSAWAGPAAATTPAAVVGRASLHELAYPAFPSLGQGLFIESHFSRTAAAPVFGTGAAGECAVWSRTPEEVAADRAGDDAGLLQWSTSSAAPALPACTYVAGTGYRCVRAGSQVLGGTLAVGPAGTMVYVNVNATFTDADVGAHLVLSGAASRASDGEYPIVAFVSPSTVVVAASLAAEALPASAVAMVVAGRGATPGKADPGFLADADTASLSIAGAPGGLDAAVAGPVEVGDDFTLDAPSQALLSAIPLDGGDFTLTCDACGAATVTMLVIRTTDGDLAGLAPWVLPPPSTREVVVECSAVGTGSVTVPAAVATWLQGAGATRIEARYLRSGAAQVAVDQVLVLAGHGVIGVTTP